MVTIKDIALKTGLGIGTISRVLNDDARVRPETRELVLKSMMELNYHPSAVARRMASRSMNIVGLVFPAAARPIWGIQGYFKLVLDSITEVANVRKHNLLVYTDYIWEDPPASYSTLLDRRCDGLLLFHMPEQSPLLDVLLRSQVPFVLVNDTSDDPRASFVDIDNYAIATQVGQYLVQHGHRRIAVVSGLPDLRDYYYVTKRFEGFRDALHAGQPDNNTILVRKELALDDAELSGLLGLPANKRPSAVVVMSAQEAVCALSLIHAHELRVPEDVSLIYFDDGGDLPEHMPEMTAVTQPIERVGQLAFEALTDLVSSGPGTVRREVLPADFVVRQSSGVAPLG